MIIPENTSIYGNLNVYGNSQITSAGIVSANMLEVSLTSNSIVSAGQIAWNPTYKTFDMGLINGSVLQVGQEFLVYAKNDTSATILNGSVVYIVSGSSPNGFLHVNLASKNSSVLPYGDQVIGIATQDIPSSSSGYVTKYGLVNGINTSQLLPGNRVYLGLSGTYTSSVPVYPDHSVVLGYCVNSHITSGSIFVNVVDEVAIEEIYNVNITNPTMGDSFIYENNRWINRNFGAITKESTGFKSPELVTVSYNESTRQITLSGSVEAYWRSNLVPSLSAGFVSTPHLTGVSATQFLYYDGTNFVWGDGVPWSFNMLQIAAVIFDSNGIYYFTLRETHGTMQWQVHQELHLNIGTYLVSGGDISSFALNSTVTSARRPDILSTMLGDEDLFTTLPTLNNKSYTTFNISGTNSGIFTSGSSDIIPLNVNRPYYNQYNGSSWVQTQFPNNDYGAIFIMAVPVALDSKSQNRRYLFIQPQSTDPSLQTIQALTPSSLNLDSLSYSPEYNFIGKIIIRYTASDWALISVEKLSVTRGSSSSINAGFLSIVNVGNALSGTGTAASPLNLLGDYIPGTYTKVVTNNYGIVTSGGNLTSSDIPSLNYLPLSGGVLTGSLSGTSISASSLLVSNLTSNRLPMITTGGLFTSDADHLWGTGVSGLTLGRGSGSAARYLVFDHGSSQAHGLLFNTLGLNRWAFYAAGANDDLKFEAYDTSGVSIDIPIVITRSAGGNISLVRPLTSTQKISSTGLNNISFGGTSKVLISDTSKNIIESSITSATLSYLDATSSIQTQFNNISTNYFPTSSVSLSVNQIAIGSGSGISGTSALIVSGGGIYSVGGVNVQTTLDSSASNELITNIYDTTMTSSNNWVGTNWVTSAIANTGVITNVAVNSATKTFTRTSGSYLTDGFMVGQTVIWSGFTNSGNNVSSFAITVLNATTMTLGGATGLVTVASSASVSCLANGFVHISGTSPAILSAYPATIGNTYKVIITTNTISAGTLTISYGGNIAGITNQAGTVGQLVGSLTDYETIVTPTTTAGLVLTPNAAWRGNVYGVSITQVTRSNPSLTLLNAAGVISMDARGSNATSYGFGVNACGLNTIGVNNQGFGTNALACNTTASFNTAIGVEALRFNTTGNHNAAIGMRALANNVTGIYNMAVGYAALFTNTIGSNNVGIGGNALQKNTVGSRLIGIGRNALISNASASDNIGIGYAVLNSNSTGINNVGIGTQSLFSSTTDNNIGIGYFAGCYNTAGNKLFIDSYDRTNIAGELSGSIITGTLDALPSNQLLTLNAITTIPYNLNVSGTVKIDSLNGILNANNGIISANVDQGCFVYATSSTGATLNVNTKFSGFDSNDYNLTSSFITSSQQFNPKTPGYYIVNCNFNFYSSATINPASASTYTAQSIIYKNGNLTHSDVASPLALSANTTSTVNVGSVIYLNGSSDYLEFYYNVNFPGAQVYGTSATYQRYTWVSAHLLH